MAVNAAFVEEDLGPVRERPGLGATLGLLGGPAAYYGGVRLGAMELVSPLPALLAVALMWALATPLLLLLARSFDGVWVP